MAREDEKIYRVSGEAGDTLEKFRAELIRSGILGENSSNKDFMEYLSNHLSDIVSKKDFSNKNQRTGDFPKSFVLVPDLKMEQEIFSCMNEVNDSVHHIDICGQGIEMLDYGDGADSLSETKSTMYRWIEDNQTKGKDELCFI